MKRPGAPTSIADCLAAAQRIAAKIQRLTIHTPADQLATSEALKDLSVTLHILGCDAGRLLPLTERRAARAISAQRLCRLWEDSIAKAEAEGNEENAALFRDALAEATADVVRETSAGAIFQLPPKDELPS